jgi:hypothetical protein
VKGEKRMAATEMECDLVVLGGGGAGLVAAVKASEDSGKKVIVLEKAKKLGGATYFANGPGVGSMMGGAPGGKGGPGGKSGPGGGPGGQSGGPGGGPAGPGGGAQGIMGQFSSWFSAKVGSENFVKTPRMEEFKNLDDPSIGPGRGGTFAIDRMREFCQKQGIQILTETPAKKFVTDSNGKITGVLAESKDGQVLVKCKACVIASGGFGRNYEKLKKYWPEEYNNEEIFFLCPPGMMGDGIDMAESIGAYIDQTKWSQDAAGGFFLNYPIHHPYSWAVMSLMADGKFVSINLKGNRWKDESSNKPSLATQPGSVAYSVGDSEIVETVGAQLINGGLTGPGGATVTAESNEGKAIRKWREDLEYEVAIDEKYGKGNHAKKANTLVELALKMNIDPKTFVETIERYNKFCETGVDAEFGKAAKHLKPVRKAPFYAIYGHRFSQCTKGLNGIAVNTNFEVLNPKGEAMPGLFAAGDTCTIYGGLVLQGGAPGFRSSSNENKTAAAGGNILSTTPSPCGGSTAAFAAGYSAGVSAAKYLKNI